MDQYGIGSASWTEIVWTAATAPGALTCLVLLVIAIADLRWLHAEKLNGERRLLALNSVVGEAISTVVLGLFAFLGAWLMFIPAARPHMSPTRLQIVLTSAFVLAAVLLTAHAVLRYYWRAEYIRRRMKRDRQAAQQRDSGSAC